jgi:hypothetical protein
MEMRGIFCIVNGFQMCTRKVGIVTFVFHTMPFLKIIGGNNQDKFQMNLFVCYIYIKNKHHCQMLMFLEKYLLGRGYTRDWLPAYSFVLRAWARRDTTRQDCFVLIPAHTGVTIVYCGTVVPLCSSQMSAQ